MLRKYKKDFPSTGNLNWKKVVLNMPDSVYYDKKIIVGVLLHNGKLRINGMIFNSNEFTVIDENPIKNLTIK